MALDDITRALEEAVKDHMKEQPWRSSCAECGETVDLDIDIDNDMDMRITVPVCKCAQRDDD